ncbi:MAG: PrsW family intramembrane metalloprotease [Candidatus Dormibacteraceae bacterium]
MTPPVRYLPPPVGAYALPAAAPPVPAPQAGDPWYDNGVRIALAVVAGLSLILFGSTIYGAFQGSLTTIISVYDLGGVLLTALLGAILLAVILLVNRGEPDPRRRHALLLTGAVGVIGAMLLWLTLLPLLMSVVFSESLILCVPPTLLALWVLRRIMPNRRLPWWLLFVALGWGGLIAPNLAIVTEEIWSVVTTNLIPGLGAGVAGAFSPGLFEEGSNGLGVILLYLLFRGRIDGVIGGICLGAAVGLGFNLLESGEYMFAGLITGGPASFGVEFLFRQVLGLFAGHATYTALTGAGLGVARTLGGWRPKAAAVAAGLITAVSAHFLWDFIAMTNLGPSSNDDWIELAVITPLTYLVLDGPFVLMLAVLLVLGWRTEKLSLATQFKAEAASGRGVVVAAELPILESPRRRAGIRLRAMWRSSWRHYRWLVAIQEAQVELAALRWQRESERVDAARATQREAVLAQRILDLKRHPPRRLSLRSRRERARAATA